MSALDGWENFYVIVGSSAGALIGLQFVVLTLINEAPIAGNDAQAGAAFTTPSVVHFGIVLLLSAIVSAPWNGIGAVAILWGLIGVGGIIYTVIVTRRLRVQKIYKPVFEDWLFHVLLPLAAYAMMAGSAGAPGSFLRRCRSAFAALHWHSQCLGHRHLSRLCEETRRQASKIKSFTKEIKMEIKRSGSQPFGKAPVIF